MNYQFLIKLFAVTFLLVFSISPVMGQEIPRTSWGDPDLQGAWTNATMTPLQLSLIHI